MRDEISGDSQKELARLLYTEHDSSIRDVALRVGVEEACVRNWIAVHKWDDIKRSLLTSKRVQLQHMYSLLETLNTKINDGQDVTAKDVDIYVKYTAAIKNLEGDISIATIIQVGGMFVNWLRRKDLELTRTIAAQFDAFINYKLSPLNQ